MHLLRSFSLLSLVGIINYLSSDLVAMEPLQPEPQKILSQTLDNEIISVPFTYMRALKMQYQDFNEEAYNACCIKGIQEKLGGNLPVAINAFLDAASYRKIPAFKFLAQCYKQSGQYIEAFKWMMWAGQESVLQDVKFEWPAEFCDITFRAKIFEYDNKGIVEGKKIISSHKFFWTNWSNMIKCSGKINIELFTQQVLSDSYDTYPSQLEPYLTKEECHAKKYLFKGPEKLYALVIEVSSGKLNNQTDICRLIAALMAKLDVRNINIIASIYEHIEDCQNAKYYWRKGISLGSDMAKFRLGVLHQRLGENKEAFDFVLKSVEDGYAAAQAQLGFYYLKGIGTEINLEEAFILFLKAAERNEVLGLYNVGSCYNHGNGVQKNYAKAKEYFEKAAALGDATALNDLAVIYSIGGWGITKDYIKAEEYYLKSVEKGEPLAIDGYASFLLGKNNSKAFGHALKAVELGVKGSQFLLGFCYIDGLGVKQNKKRGFDLVKNEIEIILNDENFIIGTKKNRMFHLIKKHHNLMIQKKHIYIDDVVRSEIKRLRELIIPLYSKEDGALNSYYQAYFAYIDGNLQCAHDLFCEAYASGVEGCKDMITLIASSLKKRQLEEDRLSLSDSINAESGESVSEEEVIKDSNFDLCLSYREFQAEDTFIPIEIEQKDSEVDFEVSKKKEHSLNKHSHEQKKAKAKEAKELKLQQYDLRAREKLQLKVAEVCGVGSMNPEVGAPRELEYLFDNSAAGKEVSEKFQELLSEDNSKLADILNDIKFGYKTNKVHPLTGPLKGYYARKISDYHRLVYRWIGPGQLEIRSCETHYGK